MTKSRRLWWVPMVAISVYGMLMTIGGCGVGSRLAADYAGPRAVVEPSISNSHELRETRLAAGDEVEIKFAYAERFNETQIIRPDGLLSLQLVGEIPAAGKTPKELRDELVRRYAVELKHPELVVIVRSLYDRRVYVGGAVKAPGTVAMPGRLTVLEAILQSGGLDLDQAEEKQVVVIRQTGNDRRNYLLNLEDPLDSSSDSSFLLESRDIVYVPRTAIADLDLWVQQHIYKLLPPFTFGIGHNF